jgi:hypothetical protein
VGNVSPRGSKLAETAAATARLRIGSGRLQAARAGQFQLATEHVECRYVLSLPVTLLICDRSMTAPYVWPGMRKNGMFGANALATWAVPTWPGDDTDVSNSSMGTPLVLLLLTKVTFSALG